MTYSHLENLPDTDSLLRRGIFLFKLRRYFEAHEVWEDLWRETSPGSERLFYQGLIQGTVGMHHMSRANYGGARAQLTKALSKLAASLPPGTPPDVCEDIDEILRELRKAMEDLDVLQPGAPGLQ